VLAGRIPQRRSAASFAAGLVALASTTAGVVHAHERGDDRVIEAPIVAPASPDAHAVWRLDRMGGEPLDALVARGMALPDPELRALVRLVERTADRVAPFDWRAHGVTISVGCHAIEGLACPLGVAIPHDATTRIVLSPLVAYLTEGALETVIAHEFAHVWQFSRTPSRWAGAALLGVEVELPEDIALAELEADCLAAAWGHAPPDGARLGYWDCPPLALLRVRDAWRAAPLD